MKYEITQSLLHLGTLKIVKELGLRPLRSSGFVSAKSSGF